MFARLVQLNGALSAAGPWLEEYVCAVTAPIHPTDHRLDKVATLALWHDLNGPERVYEWSPEMVAACPELSALLETNPEITVESVMPGDTVHLVLLSDDQVDDPRALLTIESSVATVLAEAARYKSPMPSTHGFGQTAVQLRDPTCDSNLNSQGVSLRTCDLKCKTGVYGWVVMVFLQSMILTSRILEVLGGPAVCFFPVLILCLVHGFCPAHPHPETGGWIFAWPPWAGFSLGFSEAAAPRTRVKFASATIIGVYNVIRNT